jgi:hypothetical protein
MMYAMIDVENFQGLDGLKVNHLDLTDSPSSSKRPLQSRLKTNKVAEPTQSQV